MPQVYSTLSNDNCYTRYITGSNDLPQLERKVLIKGGTNVADNRLITPMGVRTEITAEEYEICKNDPVFQLHVKNGFIKVMDKSTNPEKVAADMATRDLSAPLRPEDFEADEKGAKLYIGDPKKKK